MDERVVRRIFKENIAIQSLGRSVMVIRKKISERILGKIIKGHRILPNSRKLIFRINDAIARLDYFTSIPKNSPIELTPDYFKDLEFLYQVWMECLRYAYNNYELPEFDYVREYYLQNGLKESGDLVESKLKKFRSKILSTGSADIDPLDLTTMRRAFELTIFIVIGHDKFVSFIEQVNEFLKIIRILVEDVRSNQNKTIH